MLAFLIIWAILINWIAYRKGFYSLPSGLKKEEHSPTTLQLLLSFGIYLGVALFLIPFLARFLLGTMQKMQPEMTRMPIVFLTGVQVGGMAISFYLLQLFLYKQDRSLYQKIWKNRERPPANPIEGDLGLGFLAWFLSFPFVSILGEVLDKVLKSYGLDGYEQTAVKFVKAAMGSPFSIFFVLVSVLILAPLIEEYLFRGVLQTYCRKWLGSGAAILISALCFALFHYAPTQGLGNIPLLLSLFFLGGYLGFLYERQGSLWAPIGLHMTFNAVSALRIFFFPEAG
ncbi:MAG: CPBP family intramembrane metalloprotease [Simkaniaceae bacterium]|nr:CPBP family intramembrane metalloprotease [Candidatus Sacchlamyda saccharinae]